MKSPYHILGVSPDADEETIKAAFRHKAKLYHPDHNPGDPKSERRLKRIMRARDALLDPRRRLIIDRKLGSGVGLQRKIWAAMLASISATCLSLGIWFAALNHHPGEPAPPPERLETFIEAQVESGLSEEIELQAIRSNRENLAGKQDQGQSRVQLSRNLTRANHPVRRAVWGLDAVVKKARTFALR